MAEAFPRDHACAVEHYRPPMGSLGDLARAVVCVLGCIAVGVMLAHGCVPLN
ncbi:MAG: hypothetical protein ACK4Y5_16670 [Acetobacteraceae bacterium]|jgi:hypothetical protein